MKHFIIDWDLTEDSKSESHTAEELGLPTKITVEDGYDEDDLVDDLSDKYGWCINSLIPN